MLLAVSDPRGGQRRGHVKARRDTGARHLLRGTPDLAGGGRSGANGQCCSGCRHGSRREQGKREHADASSHWSPEWSTVEVEDIARLCQIEENKLARNGR